MTRDELWQWTGRTTWTIFVILAGLTAYVNWYMPHGPMYDTGDVVCKNENGGPCAEEYREDTRALNIPNWAKFLRTSENDLLLMGLALAGILISSRPQGGYKEEA